MKKKAMKGKDKILSIGQKKKISEQTKCSQLQ